MPLAVVLLVINALLWGSSLAKPVTSESETSALYYLVNYGYIKKNSDTDAQQLLSSQGLKKAIKDFQAFAGLEQTGDLDEETVELMNTPRCGVRDIIGPGTQARRKKRYALQGSRWRTKNLTYRITKYPGTSRLSKDEVDAQIKQAFQLWQDQTNLSFERRSRGSVHIEIRFEKGEHGDGDPFDGPGGTLAHAYFPQYGGDAHFDDEEYWTIQEFRGTNLLQTAAHELGHSLGLSHSDIRNALMAPFYRGWVPNLKLHKDDIDGIQALYGEKQTGSTTTTTTRRPPSGGGDEDEDEGEGDNRDLCEDPRIDTVFSIANGTYYVFKGSLYWRLTDDSVAKGYPRNIRDDWEGLPNNIDAALTWPDNEKTYFFKGSRYWKFHNDEPEDGYPKSISKGFEGIPNNIDTAFVWGGNGKMYFFKGSDYWKFDPTRKPPVRSFIYPRSLRNWNLPARGVDAAVKWANKYTYFFRGDKYYRFNDRRFNVDNGDPPFPRDTGPWWFGCKDASGLSTAAANREEENSFVSLFDLAGDEHLDVHAGDED